MCREFLTAILRICHKLVWSQDIKQEWDKHASRFTSSWLAAMQSKRKIVRIAVDLDKQDELIELIDDADDWPASWREGAKKDVLLVSAAWEADELIASADDRVRELFGRLAAKSAPLGRTVWINPRSPSDEPLRWLESGARRSRNKRLSAVIDPDRPSAGRDVIARKIVFKGDTGAPSHTTRR
jgi:hypothetical protein